MTAWSRALIDTLVVLPSGFLLVIASTAILVQHAIKIFPRAYGLWTVRDPVPFLVDAILPSHREAKTEEPEGEIEPYTARAVPIWNENRSGDLFVAVILSLIVPWIVLRLLQTFSLKVWILFHIRLY